MTSNPYKTVLTISIGLLIFYYFFNYNILIYITLALGVLSLAFERFSLIIEKVWFGIAFILGLIIPNIVMSLIFYFFLTPIAFIYKLFKNDPLMLNNNNYKSYFVNSKYDTSKKSFEKIW